MMVGLMCPQATLAEHAKDALMGTMDFPISLMASVYPAIAILLEAPATNATRQQGNAGASLDPREEIAPNAPPIDMST